MSDSGDTKNSNKADSSKLTRLVSFRLTDADHKAYLEKVEASGLKPSTFFRDCVLTNKTHIIARPKSSLEKSRLLYLFNKASNNINQLAHRANSEHKGGSLSDGTYREILDALDDLSRDMKDILRRVD